MGKLTEQPLHWDMVDGKKEQKENAENYFNPMEGGENCHGRGIGDSSSST